MESTSTTTQLPIPPPGDQIHIPHPEKSDLVFGIDERQEAACFILLLGEDVLINGVINAFYIYGLFCYIINLFGFG